MTRSDAVGDNLLNDKNTKCTKEELRKKRKALKKKSKKKTGYLTRFNGSQSMKPGESMIHTMPMTEGKSSPFSKLKDNKVKLSPEERKEVMSKKAVWHHGNHGEATPAVWKTTDGKGKTVYVTNTHRAYQVRPTLAGAISIFHKFIKGTA
jgi:hypothetical protein